MERCCVRTLCAVTVGRSDWGIYRPVLQAIERDSQLKSHLIAGGAHLLPEHGSTLETIEADGFEVHDQLDMLLSDDTPVGVAKSMGLGTLGFADLYNRIRPDMLLLLGDRFEMHAAAVAAIPFKIPMAHIHGGEVSQGAIDDCLRHAITKYSHLHFPSTVENAQRIMQLGEEPWRITVSGAPALDNLAIHSLLSNEELAKRIGIRLPEKPLLVCYHPVTLQFEKTEQQAQELVAALDFYKGPIVVTRPNADVGNQSIVRIFEQFSATRSNVQLVDNLGTQAFFSLMNESSAMVGNSSSGIIEAASFHLPVVNIGLRQGGRAQSNNVINCDCNRLAIEGAIQRAISEEFCQHVKQVVNIYGDGSAAEKIVARLKSVALNERLMVKQFVDVLPESFVPSQAA